MFFRQFVSDLAGSESAGSLIIKLQIVTGCILLAKQYLSDCIVGSTACISRMEITAADMCCNAFTTSTNALTANE